MSQPTDEGGVAGGQHAADEAARTESGAQPPADLEHGGGDERRPSPGRARCGRRWRRRGWRPAPTDANPAIRIGSAHGEEATAGAVQAGSNVGHAWVPPESRSPSYGVRTALFPSDVVTITRLVDIVPQLGRKGLATVLVACLALVACGDDDEGGASDTTAATAPPGSVIEGDQVEVAAVDNCLRPRVGPGGGRDRGHVPQHRAQRAQRDPRGHERTPTGASTPRTSSPGDEGRRSP